MSKTPYYNFDLVPLQTDMTVRQFRQAIVGEDTGNFALLDSILAGLDVVTCSVDVTSAGSYVLVLTRKDGTKITADLPDFGEIKEEDFSICTEQEFDELWDNVFSQD